MGFKVSGQIGLTVARGLVLKSYIHPNYIKNGRIVFGPHGPQKLKSGLYILYN